MTESEAKGFVQGKLDCMKKCGVFNKEDNISDKDCDYCHYCYSQGNFGEQKEAFSVAINALEKQIPKKPYRDKDQIIRYINTYYCPVCKKGITGTNIAQWCYHCGQKIDWSDEE